MIQISYYHTPVENNLAPTACSFREDMKTMACCLACTFWLLDARIQLWNKPSFDLSTLLKHCSFDLGLRSWVQSTVAGIPQSFTAFEGMENVSPFYANSCRGKEIASVAASYHWLYSSFSWSRRKKKSSLREPKFWNSPFGFWTLFLTILKFSIDVVSHYLAKPSYGMRIATSN